MSVADLTAFPRLEKVPSNVADRAFYTTVKVRLGGKPVRTSSLTSLIHRPVIRQILVSLVLLVPLVPLVPLVLRCRLAAGYRVLNA